MILAIVLGLFATPVHLFIVIYIAKEEGLCKNLSALTQIKGVVGNECVEIKLDSPSEHVRDDSLHLIGGARPRGHQMAECSSGSLGASAWPISMVLSMGCKTFMGIWCPFNDNAAVD